MRLLCHVTVIDETYFRPSDLDDTITCRGQLSGSVEADVDRPRDTAPLLLSPPTSLVNGVHKWCRNTHSILLPNHNIYSRFYTLEIVGMRIQHAYLAYLYGKINALCYISVKLTLPISFISNHWRHIKKRLIFTKKNIHTEHYQNTVKIEKRKLFCLECVLNVKWCAFKHKIKLWCSVMQSRK